jgi:hypothetical protein
MGRSGSTDIRIRVVLYFQTLCATAIIPRVSGPTMTAAALIGLEVDINASCYSRLCQITMDPPGTAGAIERKIELLHSVLVNPMPSKYMIL